MLCLRIFLLIFAIAFTACVTSSILLPLFRLETLSDDLNKTRLTTYYWYREMVTTVSGDTLILREYARDFACTNQRVIHLMASVLSVVAASMGGIVVLLLACWSSAGHRRCLGALALCATFVVFASCAVTLTLSVYAYITNFCGTGSLESQFKLAEGFALICSATGGFFILFLLVSIELCCCRTASFSDMGANNYHK